MRRVAALVLVVAALAATGPTEAASPQPANFATAGDVVDYAYTKVLGREPDRGGLGFFVRSMEAPGADPVALVDALSHSGEYDAWMGQLLRAYRTAYARGADQAGAEYWLSRRAISTAPSFRQDAYGAFLGGAEFAANYGGTSDAEFVRRIYVNALGRQPDQGGWNFWTSRIAAVGRAQVLFEISESAEHRGLRRIEVEITGTYLSLLDRLPDAGGQSAWEAYFRAGGSARGFLAGVWRSAEHTARLATVPSLAVSTLVSGLSIPWGLAFAPDGTLVYTQRGGVLQARRPNGTVVTVAAALADVYAVGEGGLLDLALDPGYASNRRFYLCMDRGNGSGGPLDVAVTAWTMAADFTSATRDAGAPLVAGMPIAASGRHSGCRILPDPTTPGVLFVATGDAAIGTQPQDLRALGGKVLRVSATTGLGVAGNPFFGDANVNTARIHGFGHRNVQGLAHRPGTNQIWTAEHGPDRDDELNLAVPGGNYGWNPVPGYDERVPMTDLAEFPAAVPAVWSSGSSTVATSGMAFLDGCAWGAYDDHAAVALLKGSELRIHSFTTGTPIDLGFVVPAPLDGTHGRLRTVVLGPDGALYVATANGGGADQILRVVPTGGRCAAG